MSDTSAQFKVYILASDAYPLERKLAPAIAKRGVAVEVFMDLETLFKASVLTKPDLICISMGFVHPKVMFFPQVFNKTIKTKTLSFAESNDTEELKKVTMSVSDLSIRGKMSANSLWVKVKKLIDEEEAAQAEEKKKENSTKAEGAVHIKGSSDFKLSEQNGGELESKLWNKFSSMVNDLKEENLESNKAGSLGEEEVVGGKNNASFATSDRGVQTNNNTQESINSSVDTSKNKDMNKNFGYQDLTPNPENKQGKIIGDVGYNSFTASDSDPSNKPASTEPLSAMAGNQSSSAESTSDNGNGFPLGTGSSVNPMSDSPTLGNTKKKNSLANSGKGQEDKSKNSSANKNLSEFDNNNLNNKGAVSTSKTDNKKKAEDLQTGNASSLKNNQMGNESTNSAKTKKGDHSSALDKKSKNKEAHESDAAGDEKNSEDPSLLQKELNRKTREDSEAKAKEKFGGVSVKETELEKKQREAKERKERQDELERRKQEVEEKVSIIEKCSSKSMDLTVDVLDTKKSNFSDVSKISVIPVNNELVKGFLLISTNTNERINTDILMEFRTNLINLTAEESFRGIEDCFSVEVPLTAIGEWSVQEGQFEILKEDQDGTQYMITFILREKVLPHLKSYRDKNMSLVDLQHVPPDTAVDFNAFVHLPKNQKYVHYLKKGKSVSLVQLKRLSTANVEGLLIPSDEKNNFKKFFVRKAIEWEFLTFNNAKKSS